MVQRKPDLQVFSVNHHKKNFKTISYCIEDEVFIRAFHKKNLLYIIRIKVHVIIRNARISDSLRNPYFSNRQTLYSIAHKGHFEQLILRGIWPHLLPIIDKVEKE